MFKRLYNWTLDLAGRPNAPYALAVVSFAESSFFPIPPDVMLVPMGLAQPKKIWWYAFICSVASILGGILGYYIGMSFMDTVGDWILNVLKLKESYLEIRSKMTMDGALPQGWWETLLGGKWGAAILVKGLLPIPYKLITITSGAIHFSFLHFIILSTITRAGRFFIVALLMSQFGPFIKKQLDKHLNLAIILFVVALIGGFLAFKYIF